MKKLTFSVLFIILLGTSACIQKPYDYLYNRDYDGLKKMVLLNPDYVKRKQCHKKDYYCINSSYFSLVDYLCMYNFISEPEDAELLKFLLENGGPISNKSFTEYYREPLYRALKARRNILAKVLIEHNQHKPSDDFDINDLTFNKTSALTVASLQRNNKEMIEYIISKGGDVNKKNKYKLSPLDVAFSIPNNAQNISTLLEHGAKLNKNKKINFTFHFLKNLEILINNDISVLNSNNYIYYNYYQEIDLSRVLRTYLKELGVDLTLSKYDYIRNIHTLTFIDDVNISKKAIDLCLENNKDCSTYINSLTYLGYSPLVFSFNDNNYELMEYLLEKGADVNLKNKFSLTALHLAILAKNELAIEILLKNNADITIKDINENTAKDLYLKYFNADIVKLKNTLVIKKVEKTQKSLDNKIEEKVEEKVDKALKLNDKERIKKELKEEIKKEIKTELKKEKI